MNPTNDWEARFDKQFVRYDKFMCDPPGIPTLIGDPFKVKSFIRTLLSTRTNSLREKVEDIAKKYETSSGARHALEEIATLLEQEEGKV